jgi:hypothetical protein
MPSSPIDSNLPADLHPLGSSSSSNPYECPVVDRYLSTKSTANETLPSFVKVWASLQIKQHKPHINRLDGKGRMTRFERAKLLGFRAMRLEQGDEPRVATSI